MACTQVRMTDVIPPTTPIAVASSANGQLNLIGRAVMTLLSARRCTQKIGGFLCGCGQYLLPDESIVRFTPIFENCPWPELMKNFEQYFRRKWRKFLWKYRSNVSLLIGVCPKSRSHAKRLQSRLCYLHTHIAPSRCSAINVLYCEQSIVETADYHCTALRFAGCA